MNVDPIFMDLAMCSAWHRLYYRYSNKFVHRIVGLGCADTPLAEMVDEKSLLIQVRYNHPHDKGKDD